MAIPGTHTHTRTLTLPLSRRNARWADAERHLRSLDARWDTRIDHVGPCRLRPHRDRFALLVRSIVSQQISTKAAASIERRLRTLVGGRHEPARLLTLPDADLRAAGLSAMKVAYLRDLAGAVAEGRLPLHRAGRWSDDELIERLTQVKGIGRWTAEMFMIFGLNRPDVLPVGDLGVRMGIQRHFNLDAAPDPRACHALAEPWRPYRTIAIWYLWRETDQTPAATR